MSAKLPFFKFFPSDWVSESSLRVCSLAARGFWIEMLCIMWTSDSRGYLQMNGNPVTPEQLARMTGCSQDEASHHLQELETAGVFSRDRRGIIYSRRILKDEQEREETYERVKKHRSNGECNESVTAVVTPLKQECNGKVTGIFQKSDVRCQKSDSIPPHPPSEETPEFQKFWECYPKKLGKGAARTSFKKMKCESVIDRIIASVESQKSSEQWKKDEGRYIPFPATWLNQSRWEDEAFNPLKKSDNWSYWDKDNKEIKKGITIHECNQ